jgi:hypothetical protein
MRWILCLLFAVSLSAVHAQNDDMPDYRSKKDSYTKMAEKDIKNDLATFTMTGIDESVGKAPLVRIPATNYGNNFMTFEGNNIKVEIKSGPFFPTQHRLDYADDNSKYLVKIDKKAYYGNYGTMPGTQINSITVVVDKDTVAIPSTAYFDLYNPNLTYAEGGNQKSYNGVYLSPDKHNIYIYMLSRDPNGSYEVTWVIKDKKYLRRVVDYGFLK